TGGLAPMILKECSTPIQHEPALTLTGLRILYERNVEDP
ncbi:MAG TPA: pantothenate kinase, partial [Actinomycetota bacterium]|nr:pantothenate kinase [Actinomycetota bacterium]